MLSVKEKHLINKMLIKRRILPNKKGYAYREYWKAFKRNFKQATLCFLMWFVVAIFLVGDVIITKQVLRQDTQLGASYYFFLVLAGAALAWEFYLFSYI